MEQRLGKVREMLDAEGLDGVLVTSEANVSWLTAGRYHINIATENACAVLWITRQTVECLVNNIEAQRLADEEGLRCDVLHVYPWYDETSRLKHLRRWTEGRRHSDDAKLAAPFQRLRTVLDAAQEQQLRELGGLVAQAVEHTCRQCHPGDREYEAAGWLAQACLAAGVEPVVNLVAGARRAELYRHALPTDDPLGRYALVSVSGRRHGLVASATRMVHFGAPSDEIANKHDSVLRIDAAYIANSRPGLTLGEVLQSGIDAYGAQGYADEWRHHHQGGLAGYLSREIKAVPSLPAVIETGQTLAWNPTIRGVKSEDTIWIGEAGAEVITATGAFPAVDIAVGGQRIRRPGMLVR
ncbi:MAG: M24 family metallopeptidase [Bacilli bacterium]